tara:strand:- start:329 stop:1588 length:1260 start_codon:yes stop_codon:yes gene_type:complete
MIKSIKHDIKRVYEFRRNFSFLGIINAFRFFIRIKKIPPVDILYSCHDVSRPLLLNGKYYSPLIDALIIKLNNYSNLTLASPFSKYSGNKASGNTVNLNLYVIVSLLRRLFTSGSITLKNTKNDPLIKFYDKLYEQLNLKIIIAIQPSIEMCIAAKQNKIKIIDVQHGVIGTEESSSYYSLDRRFLYKNSGWPDYILCRNMESYKNALKLKDYTKPVLVGNLNKFFYENIYPSKENTTLVKKKVKTILFTFQPYYNSLAFSKNNMHEGIIFPKALLKLILKSNYNFVLKLHPIQIQNKNLLKSYIKAFDKLFAGCKNVDFILCNQKPLEYSLANSDLHITFNSASLFDAIDYGLKTILLDHNLTRLNQYFGELMDSNSVIVDPNLEIDFSNHFSENNQKTYNEASNDFNLEDFISKNIR